MLGGCKEQYPPWISIGEDIIVQEAFETGLGFQKGKRMVCNSSDMRNNESEKIGHV